MKVNNLDWLEIAEYLSLSGAVIGSIAAVASQQVIYAATPMSLSLVLNLFNRHRWEQHTRNRLTTTVTQLDQKLFSIKALIERRVDDLRMDIAQLNEQAQKIQASQDLESVKTVLMKLQQQISILEQSVEVMSVQLEDFNKVGSFPANGTADEVPVVNGVRLEEIPSTPPQNALRNPPQPETVMDSQDVLKRYHW